MNSNYFDNINKKIIENLEEDDEYQLLTSFLNSLSIDKIYNPIDVIKIEYRKIIVKKRIREIKKHYFEEVKTEILKQPVTVNKKYQKTKKIPVLQQR